MENNKVSNQQVEAKRFIEENDLEKIISEMMNSLVYEKPKQPLVYMIKYLSGLLSDEERKYYNLIIPEPYPKGRPVVKFPNLDKVTNPLKNILTKTLWTNIKYKKTKYGGSVMNLIKISENNINEKIGLILCDGECINTFEQLVIPIINIANKIENQKLEEFTPYPVLSTQAHFPYNEKILINTKLIRIAYSRNLNEFAFSAIINDKSRENVENSIINTINNLINERILNTGKFYFLKENENEAISILKESLHDFDEIEAILNSAELKNNWPNNRSIFVSESEEISIIILINFIDHLKLITTLKDKNCDFSKLFNSSHNIIKSLEKYLTFEFDKLFGYTNSCLDNLGAGMEISSLISLKNIINSENFETKIKSFELDNYRSDKINCQFFSKNKFKLCQFNQLEFIQSYYNFICGLINIDNKFEFIGEKEVEIIHEFNFSKFKKLDIYTEDSEELAIFQKKSSNKNEKEKININIFKISDEQLVKSKSVIAAYFNNFEKYKNTISPIGTNLNDIVQSFLSDDEYSANKNFSNLNFLKNQIYFSDTCEFNTFKSFVSNFILAYQNFNVDDLDHIHKQDLFKNLPSISDANKIKLKSLRMTCFRNLADAVFGLNSSLFNSASKIKEIVFKSLEAMQKEFEYLSIEKDKFKKIINENEINLNIPIDFNLEEYNKNKNLNFGNERGLIKLENGICIIINDIEHLRFECYEKSGDINKMFMNLLNFINSFGKNVKFSYDKKLGFVTSNPEYIGTGLIIEICVELKNLLNEEENFNQNFKDNIFKYDIINKEEGIVKIKNHITIGYSENDLIGNFILLINDLIEQDKK